MGNDRLSAIFAELTPEDGDRRLPFRWQMRLLRRLLDADLPRVVGVPTGLGKTVVMALWLIALAEGAGLPRRLVYVVDRRAVVDQATRFAERWRSNTLSEFDHLAFPPPAGTYWRHCPAPQTGEKEFRGSVCGLVTGAPGDDSRDQGAIVRRIGWDSAA